MSCWNFTPTVVLHGLDTCYLLMLSVSTLIVRILRSGPQVMFTLAAQTRCQSIEHYCEHTLFPRTHTRIRARTRAVYGAWVSLWSSQCLNATLFVANARTPSVTTALDSECEYELNNPVVVTKILTSLGFEQLIRRPPIQDWGENKYSTKMY